MIIKYIGVGTTTLPDFTSIVRTLSNGDTIQVEDLTGVQLTQMYPDNWINAQPIGPGGSSLPTYIISLPGIGLNATGTAFTAFAEFIYMANGVIQYNKPTIPALSTINQTIQNGYLRHISLWVTIGGTTPTFFWKRGNEINGGAITLPLTLVEEDVAGATLVYQCLIQNTSGATITIGTDPIVGQVSMIQPRLAGTQSVMAKNPCLYFDNVAGSLKYKNTFSINDIKISSGGSPDTSLMSGYTLANGASSNLYVCYHSTGFDSELYLTTTIAQGMVLVATVSLNNSSGSLWTRGVDALSIVIGTITNKSDDPFLGGFSNAAEISTAKVQAQNGNIAKFTSGFSIYNSGTRTALGGSSSGGTFQATTGFDFRQFGVSNVLVKTNSSGNVVPLHNIYNSSGNVVPLHNIYNSIASALGSDIVRQVQVSMNSQLVVEIQADSMGSIMATQSIYNIDTGNIASSSTSINIASGCDTTKPIYASKLSGDIFAMSYVNTSGDGVVVRCRCEGQNTVVVDSRTVVAMSCGEIQVFEGQHNFDASQRGTIIFGIGSLSDNLFHLGYIEVDANRKFVSTFEDYIDNGGPGIAYAAGDAFSFDGAGIGTTGCLLAAKDGGLYYIGTYSGGSFASVIASNNSTPSSSANDVICQYLGGAAGLRWAVGYLLSGGLIQWTTTDYDGMSLNVCVATTCLAAGGRLDARGSFTTYADVDDSVYHIVTIENASMDYQQTLVDMSGYIPSSTIIDSDVINLPITLAQNYIHICPIRRQVIKNGTTFLQRLLYFSIIGLGDSTYFWQIGYQYDSNNLGYSIVREFLTVPQLNECVGMIKDANTTGAGTMVTVYCSGSTITGSFGVTGTNAYADMWGLEATDWVGVLKVGVSNGAGLLIDIEDISGQPYSMMGGLSYSDNPSYVLSNGYDVSPSYSPAWTAPVTYIFNTDGKQLSVTNLNGLGYNGNNEPNTASYQYYLKAWAKGDTITLQKSRDIAEVRRDLLEQKGVGKPIVLNCDGVTTEYDGAGGIRMPIQYQACESFLLDNMVGNIAVSNIKGLLVGQTFRLSSNTSNDIDITTVAVASATAGQIVSSSVVGVTTLIANNGDYVICKVRQNFVIEIVELGSYT